MTPLHICFISLNSYPLFVANHSGYFGGAELQISLIAKTLAKDKRIQVSLIVGDYGQKPLETIENVTLYRAFRQNRKFNLEALWFFKLLKDINADVYVERTLNLKVGLVALWCRIFGKKFVYMVAHDWDVQLNHGHYLKGLAKYSFDWGLKMANLIICQTPAQKDRLRIIFGLNSRVIRSVAAAAKSRVTKRHWLLWVGRADKWKQPELFIRLAAKLPQEKFVMICRPGNDRPYFKQICRIAQKQTNLRFFPGVSLNKINHYYQSAKALVNTSAVEGWPNTFLQAGIANTPVISLMVNPDGFINRYSCGLCGNDLVDSYRRLSKKMGTNHYRYVQRFHSPKNAERLGRILLNHFGRTAA